MRRGAGKPAPLPPGERMKIRVIRACGIGGTGFAVGDVCEPSDRDARYLIAIGKAVEADDEPLHVPAATMTTATAEAVTKPTRRRK